MFVGVLADCFSSKAILRKMALNLNVADLRKDPMRVLPREIMSIILSYLDLTTIR